MNELIFEILKVKKRFIQMIFLVFFRFSSGESDSSDTKTVVQSDAASLLNIPDPSSDLTDSPQHGGCPVQPPRSISPMSHPLSDLTAATVTIVSDGSDHSNKHQKNEHDYNQVIELTNSAQNITEELNDNLLLDYKSTGDLRFHNDTHNVIKNGKQSNECDSLTSSGYSDFSGSHQTYREDLSNSSSMNSSAPADFLTTAFYSEEPTDPKNINSTSRTNISEVCDINSVSYCGSESGFDSFNHRENSHGKKEGGQSSSNMSPSSSTSSLSNYSYSTNSCSSSPMSNAIVPAVIMRRSSAAGNKGKGTRNPSHRMSFPLAQQAKAAARTINGGNWSPNASNENVGKFSHSV